MAELEGSGGGAIGKIWRQHGGGYYALLAVGTFIFLEIRSLTSSFFESSGVRDFVEAEMMQTMVTFGLETLMNTFFAGIWPIIWFNEMGLRDTLMFAGGGYAIWAVLIAMALARREKAYRKELGL